MKLKTLYSILLVITVMPALYSQEYNLQDVKQSAKENNYAFKNSELEVQNAKAIKKEAFTNYFPKVNITAIGAKAINPLLELDIESANLPVYDGNLSNLASATQFAYFPGANIELLNQFGLGTFNISQNLYAGNKVNTGNKLASLNIEVQEQQQDLLEDELMLKAEKEFWLVITLKEKLKTIDSYDAFLEKLHTEVSDALKNGLVIRNDLLKVEIKQSELKIKRIQLNNGIRLATKQLCQTTGIAYTETLSFKGGLDELENPMSLYVDKDKAIVQRDEYQLLEKSIKASKLETKMEKGDLLPTVGIGLTGYYGDTFENNSDGVFNGIGYVGVTIPVSNLWENKHKIKQKKLKEEIAKNTMEDNVGLLKLQMDKAWDDLNEKDDSVWLMQETLVQTTENLRVEKDGYKNGLTSLSDLLEAQAMVNETEVKLIEAKSQYKQAISNYLVVTAR